MTNDKSDFGPDNSEQAESLSATGMFLRAFGEGSQPDATPEDPLKAPLAGTPVQLAVQRPAAPAQTAGEFTQMFRTPGSRQPATTVSQASETPVRPESPAPRTSSQAPSEQDRGAGEFTRIFVSGVTPPPPVTAKPSEEPTKASLLPAAGQPRPKGFSAPGVSGSASAEGSFTQLFNAATPNPSRPAAEPPAANPSRDSGWNNDPIFRSPQSRPPSEPPPPSVTTLLNSLGTEQRQPGGAMPNRRLTGPKPSFRAPAPVSSEPPEVSPGGVTRLIQRLAQTSPPEPVPAPTASPAAPPVSSGPGEFTRMISRMGPTSSGAEPQAPAPQSRAAGAFLRASSYAGDGAPADSTSAQVCAATGTASARTRSGSAETSGPRTPHTGCAQIEIGGDGTDPPGDQYLSAADIADRGDFPDQSR